MGSFFFGGGGALGFGLLLPNHRGLGGQWSGCFQRVRPWAHHTLPGPGGWLTGVTPSEVGTCVLLCAASGPPVGCSACGAWDSRGLLGSLPGETYPRGMGYIACSGGTQCGHVWETLCSLGAPFRCLSYWSCGTHCG